MNRGWDTLPETPGITRAVEIQHPRAVLGGTAESPGEKDQTMSPPTEAPNPLRGVARVPRVPRFRDLGTLWNLWKLHIFEVFLKLGDLGMILGCS